MNQARHQWPTEAEGAEVVAFPLRSSDPLPEFGRATVREPFSLVVDLSSEELGRRWWRGAATLAALCASALLLSPGFEPLAGSRPSGPTQMRYADLGSLATPQLADLQDAPVPLPKGIAKGEQDGLLKVSGDVSDGLYWSLRSAGASPEVAAAYLQAIATRIDVGEISPVDRFEFIVAKDSPSDPAALLYAGVERAQGDNIRLLKWAPAGRSGWFDGSVGDRSTSGLMAPVDGRVTSSFGSRTHPILRYTRFHSGVDFGARWGSPIVAAADGEVIGAGWSGGYGRQVRVAHGSGIVTTYSHMSSMAAAAGMPVRQGQVIGYVGSSGLSTGPHLHFEVRVNGQAVNPLTARLVQRPIVDERQLAAFKARLKQLQAIPVQPVGAEQAS